VPGHAVTPTTYTLNDNTFIGIPASVVYKTILYNKSNPKRKIEIEIFRKNHIMPYEEDIYTLTYKGLNITH